MIQYPIIRVKGTSQAIEAFFSNEKSKELRMLRTLFEEPHEQTQHAQSQEEPEHAIDPI